MPPSWQMILTPSAPDKPSQSGVGKRVSPLASRPVVLSIVAGNDLAPVLVNKSDHNPASSHLNVDATV